MSGAGADSVGDQPPGVSLAAALGLALTLAACAPRPSPAPAPPEAVPSAPTALFLPFDHDLFVDAPGDGAWFRMRRWTDLSRAWPVPLDLHAGTDSVKIDHEVRLPVGRAGRTLYLVTAGYGGIDARGVAAEGEVHFADNTSANFRMLVGEHAWPAFAGATGRGADALLLGENVAGDALTASVRAVSLPGGVVESVSLRPRFGLDLYLLAAAIDDAPVGAPHAAPDERPPDGFAFPIPLALTPPGGPGLAPSALHGAVTVDGEALRFADGSTAKFWGVNLVGKAALPEPSRADAVAAGLAARGFDLVRLHHIDTEATLLNPRRMEPGQPEADPAALDRLDHLHAALRQKGVYSYVEMWTQRAFREGEGVPSPEGVPVGNKYVGYVWPEWVAAQERWFSAVWDRVNPYTGLRYAEDPAVAFVELSNEDSLLTGWATGGLEKLPIPHRRRFDAVWNAWLKAKYGTDAKVAAAWSGSGRPGLEPGETLDIGTIAREPSTRARTELYPGRRSADLVDFYAELERAYYAELSRYVRSRGFTAPLVCGTAMGVPQADRQLAACDVVDAHLYWDPIGESTAFYDRSLLGDSDRWLERGAVCQAGKPCTLSEVQHSWPNRYAAEAPLAWATLAARQGFDAVLWFAWSHDTIRDLPDGPNGALDVEGRFSEDAQMPAAGAIFRRLPAAPSTFTRWWSDAALRRDLAEPSSLWLPETVGVKSWIDRQLRVSYAAEPPPVVVPTTPVAEVSASTAGPTTSSGVRSACTTGLGPTRVRWSPGRLTVEGPDYVAVVGAQAPTEEAPNPCGLHSRIRGNAAVSLVGSPEGEGTRWLLTMVGRTDRVGSLWARGAAGMLTLGGGPALLERLDGGVHLPRQYGALTPLGSDGKPGVAANGQPSDGLYVQAGDTAWWTWLGDGPRRASPPER